MSTLFRTWLMNCRSPNLLKETDNAWAACDAKVGGDSLQVLLMKETDNAWAACDAEVNDDSLQVLLMMARE